MVLCNYEPLAAYLNGYIYHFRPHLSSNHHLGDPSSLLTAGIAAARIEIKPTHYLLAK
jgi:hypothetical protein